MDRRRAAGALLALAACIASSAAAPTSTNHTALDLYEEPTEGCYYNFQHYGEGDRIMTNEPCLNCTCHNRMLMCYLRVCPFTKAIGQDCTVEKRADQCCPIVTCPDVPVDLLTSTSTSSPAEYGSTGVGKVDKYGCSINGKYFSEGAKVPQTVGKPCEHCYCIRNMTTCVMQECTLHVDGCTPIYHKDVCCPVRYFCDHPEDEIPLLGDMTTTVRPTQGFLLTTVGPTDAEIPTTTMQPTKRDCIDDDQLYPDGALIKTEKPCEHCYCMKGDIVCVVQECGTPMENEGKNCTSLPPREGQCCPDTYICDGDEVSTEPSETEVPIGQLTTTIEPPRRVSVEGSGYRNDDDVAPTVPSELEGSGEEDMPVQPETESPNKLLDKFGSKEEAEFIPITSEISTLPEEAEKATTEPYKELNTVPSGEFDEEHTELPQKEKTTLSSDVTEIEHIIADEHTTESINTFEEMETKRPTLEETTPSHTVKVTEPLIAEEQTSVDDLQENEYLNPELIHKDSTLPSILEEPETPVPVISEDEAVTEISPLEPSTTEAIKSDLPLENEHDKETTEATPILTTRREGISTDGTTTSEKEDVISDTRRTSPSIEYSTTSKSIEEEITTQQNIEDVTEPSISEHYTVPDSGIDEQSSETSLSEQNIKLDELITTKIPIINKEKTETLIPLEEETSEPSIFERTTRINDIKTSEVTLKSEGPIDQPTTVIDVEESALTTEPTFRKDDESTASMETVTSKTDITSTISSDQPKETDVPKDTSVDNSSITPQLESSTEKILEQEKPSTTEAIMELSSFAHVDDNEVTTVLSEIDAGPVSPSTEKVDLPDTTTINPEDNEIAEIPSPGRIPGEGDCLLEGTTYKNDSIVPSTNKCHTGCRCVSSIIKCDPIICSPPPENMENCQHRYDTPESCCPTYVCDHGMETIPPQPQSHITGTESPTPSIIKCQGDECEKTEDKQESAASTETPDKVAPSDCGSSGCDQTAQIPAEPCTEEKCVVPSLPTEHKQPDEIPATQACSNPDDCNEIKIPVSCEGESCTASAICDKESGCNLSESVLPEEAPVTCDNENECKQVKVPQSEPATSVKCDNESECNQVKLPEPEAVPCTDDSCKNIEEDCTSDECKIVTSLPQPSQEGTVCSEDGGCKQADIIGGCENGKCDETHSGDQPRIECTSIECMQQNPILPTQEILHMDEISTGTSINEDVTTKRTEELQPVSSESPTTKFTEELETATLTAAGTPGITIKDVSLILDEEHKVTNTLEDIPTTFVPGVTTEKSTDGPVDTENKLPEISSDEVITATPATDKEFATENPEVSVTKVSEDASEVPVKVTEVAQVDTGKPEYSTENIENLTKSPKPSESTVSGMDVTKVPESEPQRTDLPELSTAETEKPSEIEESLVTQKTPEIVTEKGSEVTTALPQSDEITNESKTKAPEPSIQEATEKQIPELQSSLNVTTRSPDFTEHAFTTVKDLQTEAPVAHMTEEQESAIEEHKEETEGMTTYSPDRSGTEKDVITTSVPDLFTTEVSSTEEQTEHKFKQPSTETAVYPFDVPQEHIPVEFDKIPANAPEKTEILTPTQPPQTKQPTITTDIEEKIPTTQKIEYEKETESSASYYPTKGDKDVTSTLLPIENIDETHTEEPQTITTEMPIPGATEFETPESPQNPEFVTEKPEPDQETYVTEKQKPSETFSSTQSTTTGQQEDLVPILETESPLLEEKMPELAFVPDHTTEVTLQSFDSEDKTEKMAELHEHATTEKEIINTLVPESEITTTVDQDLTTVQPELVKVQPPQEPVESLEEKITEKPITSEISETTEKIPIEMKPISEEAGTTAAEQEITVAFTKSPDLQESSSQTEHKATDQTTTAASPLQDDLLTLTPEQVEKVNVTDVPRIPTEATQTENSKSQEKDSTAQFDYTSPESSETTPSILHATEQPSLSTISQELSPHDTIIPGSVTTEKYDKEQQTPSSVILEELPEVTELPTDTTKDSQVLEDEKQRLPEEHLHTVIPETEETTPHLVELEQYTHKLEEELDVAPTEEPSAPTEVPVIVSSDESTNAPIQEPAVSSEEPTVSPLGVDKTPSEEPTIGPSQETTLAPLQKATIVPTEESKITPSSEHIVPSGESTVSPNAPTTISSEESNNVLPEEPIQFTSQDSMITPSVPVEAPLVPVEATSEETSKSTEHSAEGTPTSPTISAFETTIPSEKPISYQSEEVTTVKTESHETESPANEISTQYKPTEQQEIYTEKPSDQKEQSITGAESTTDSLEKTTEKSTEIAAQEEITTKPTDVLFDKYGEFDKDKETETTEPKPIESQEEPIPAETEKPTSDEEPSKHVTTKPHDVSVETTAPEEEFIPVTSKATTSKADDITTSTTTTTLSPPTLPDKKPTEMSLSTTTPEAPKPVELQPTDEIPSPEEESQFPPSGGYNQDHEEEYIEEDQTFGPGTCRYGGKVYVSAQQIPRDDPCDFCFCFRSDIICLQQSCPPPIHGCHEEPIQGFCCPRYECPVSMATTLNVTTTTTTTTTTLPPHFLTHAYKGAAQRKGCQIKGHTYQVGEVVRASSGPCLHCTCGGDGQMKCDPKQCTPEPMLRQMIAAAVSVSRRR